MRPAQHPQQQLESTHARGGVRSLIGRRGVTNSSLVEPSTMTTNQMTSRSATVMRRCVLSLLLLLGVVVRAQGQVTPVDIGSNSGQAVAPGVSLSVTTSAAAPA